MSPGAEIPRKAPALPHDDNDDPKLSLLRRTLRFNALTMPGSWAFLTLCDMPLYKI